MLQFHLMLSPRSPACLHPFWHSSMVRMQSSALAAPFLTSPSSTIGLVLSCVKSIPHPQFHPHLHRLTSTPPCSFSYKTKSFLQLLAPNACRPSSGRCFRVTFYIDRKVFDASSMCIMKCSVPPLVVTCFKFLALMGAHVGVGGGRYRALW